MVAPLKPEEQQRALARGTREEIDEYQRLISRRFSRDPSKLPGQEIEGLINENKRREDRIRELYGKLFADK